MIEANLLINCGSYCNDEAIERLIRYIYKLNPEMVFGCGFWPQTIENAVAAFENLRLMFPGNTSSQQVQHIEISFGNIKDLNFINKYANEIAQLFLPYPVCFAAHNDTDYLHTHFAISTTSLYPNQPPLIDSLWEKYINQVLSFSLQLGVKLYRKDK